MNQQSSQIFDSLGALLAYPAKSLSGPASECERLLTALNSEAREPISRFSGYVEGSSLAQHQELYTRTFEINPVCALEVGWQLFGERYERGTFIVKMRQTLRQFGLPESTELPDHLIHVLQALGRMEPDDATEFASMFVLPAMEKMLKGLAKKENIYSDLLRAIMSEIKCRHIIPAEGVQHD